MKRILAICLPLFILTLWFGYALGHHNGAQAERRAWESTASRPGDIQPRYNYTSYSNPHNGIIVARPWQRNVNVPDLRSSPVR